MTNPEQVIGETARIGVADPQPNPSTLPITVQISQRRTKNSTHSSASEPIRSYGVRVRGQRRLGSHLAPIGQKSPRSRSRSKDQHRSEEPAEKRVRREPKTPKISRECSSSAAAQKQSTRTGEPELCSKTKSQMSRKPPRLGSLRRRPNAELKARPRHNIR